MPVFDQKIFLEYFLTGQVKQANKKQMVDTTKLKFIIDYFSRCHSEMFANQKRVDPAKRAIEKLSISKTAMTTMETLLEKLVKKVRVNFSDATDAFRFFDLSHNMRMKKEHFLFNCAFLELDADYNDVSDLFDNLDSNSRGYIDEEEFK